MSGTVEVLDLRGCEWVTCLRYHSRPRAVPRVACLLFSFPCVCVCELSLRALASVIFSCCAGVAVWEPTGTLPPPLHTHTHTTHTPPTHRPCSDSVLTSVLADWSQKDIRSHPISLCLEWVFSDHLWSHFLSSTVGKFDKSNSVTKHKNTTL